MSLDVSLFDKKRGNKLKINGEGELNAVIHPHPPRDEEVFAFPFRQYFTSTGKATGSNDMRVDGSTTSVEFWIQADQEFDIYLKTLSVMVADAGAALNKFGALNALANGVEFIHETNLLGTTVLHDAVKTNLDFVRLGLGDPALGDGTSAFRADLSGGGADSYLPSLDLFKIFGLPWGIRIKKQTTDKLLFRINDNLSSGMDQFDIIGYGIKF